MPSLIIFPPARSFVWNVRHGGEGKTSRPPVAPPKSRSWNPLLALMNGAKSLGRLLHATLPWLCLVSVVAVMAALQEWEETLWPRCENIQLKSTGIVGRPRCRRWAGSPEFRADLRHNFDSLYMGQKGHMIYRLHRQNTHTVSWTWMPQIHTGRWISKISSHPSSILSTSDRERFMTGLSTSLDSITSFLLVVSKPWVHRW